MVVVGDWEFVYEVVFVEDLCCILCVVYCGFFGDEFGDCCCFCEWFFGIVQMSGVVLGQLGCVYMCLYLGECELGVLLCVECIVEDCVVFCIVDGCFQVFFCGFGGECCDGDLVFVQDVEEVVEVVFLFVYQVCCWYLCVVEGQWMCV